MKQFEQVAPGAEYGSGQDRARTQSREGKLQETPS